MLGALRAAGPWLGQLGAAWVSRPHPCPACPSCPPVDARCEPRLPAIPSCPACPACPALSCGLAPEAACAPCPACPAVACEAPAAEACAAPAPAEGWGFQAGLPLGLVVGVLGTLAVLLGLLALRRAAAWAIERLDPRRDGEPALDAQPRAPGAAPRFQAIRA